MWVVEVIFNDGEVDKNFFLNQESAFNFFDNCVYIELNVKYPYYI